MRPGGRTPASFGAENTHDEGIVREETRTVSKRQGLETLVLQLNRASVPDTQDRKYERKCHKYGISTVLVSPPLRSSTPYLAKVFVVPAREITRQKQQAQP